MAPNSYLDLETFIKHLDLEKPLKLKGEDKSNDDSLNLLEKNCTSENLLALSVSNFSQILVNCADRGKVQQNEDMYIEESCTHSSHSKNSVNNISSSNLRPHSISEQNLIDYGHYQFASSPFYPSYMLNQSKPLHSSMIHQTYTSNIHYSIPFYMSKHIPIQGSSFKSFPPQTFQAQQSNVMTSHLNNAMKCNSFPSSVNYKNDVSSFSKLRTSDNQELYNSNKSSISSEEESLNVKDSANATHKLLDKQQSFLTQFTSIKDFVRNCQNPRQFLCSMKCNKVILHLAEQSNQNQLHLLLEMIIPILNKLIVSNSGNYFCQDFFSLLNREDRKTVWCTIKDSLNYYGVQQFANHVIQKLVDLATEPKEQKEIEDNLSNHFNILAFNSNGTHILQKVLINFTESSKQRLTTYIVSNFQTLVFSSCGVCLIKKYTVLLKWKSRKLKNDFLFRIAPLIPSMINDIYAHYSILCIIDEWNQNDYKSITEFIMDDLAKLSCQKYASRIIERILRTSRKVSS